MKKLVIGALCLGAFAFSSSVFATSNTISGASVTKLWVYETNDDTVHVRVHLNGLQKPGPNPANTANTCEIRTYNTSVYSALLTAMTTKTTVDVEYVDASSGGTSCKVYAVTANDS